MSGAAPSSFQLSRAGLVTETLFAISNHELDGQQAFMDGKCSIQENLGLLMRMNNLFGYAK